VRRRDFITLLGGAAAAWPLAARAQQGERMRRIGVLMGTAESDSDQSALVSVFTQALAGLGWREGSKLHIEYRWAAGNIARLRSQAAELARLAPDTIFAQGTPATTELRHVAPTIPIVFVNVTDPISTGLVSSLAHPGGNITGFTNYEYSMGGKWLEILREIVPGVSRVGVIFNPDNPVMVGQVRSIEAAAAALRVDTVARRGRNAGEFEQAISASATEPNSGALVLLDFVTLAHRELIIGSAARHRLPAGYSLRVFATEGGLFSYGIEAADLFRRAASYVDRILNGAKPAELPVQQPNKFELLINLKTAKALGLEVSPQLLARADEVIE
jgi:putative ABC transport system substrate-binding protein